MKVEIVGAGQIRRTVTALSAHAGHEAWLADSHGSESPRDLMAPLDERGHAATVGEAIQAGELVVVGVPGRVVPVPPGGVVRWGRWWWTPGTTTRSATADPRPSCGAGTT